MDFLTPFYDHEAQNHGFTWFHRAILFPCYYFRHPKHKNGNVILSCLFSSPNLNNGVFGHISQRSFDTAHIWVKMLTSKIFKNPNPWVRLRFLVENLHFQVIFTEIYKTQKCVLCFVKNILTKHTTQNAKHKTQIFKTQNQNTVGRILR